MPLTDPLIAEPWCFSEFLYSIRTGVVDRSRPPATLAAHGIGSGRGAIGRLIITGSNWAFALMVLPGFILNVTGFASVGWQICRIRERADDRTA